MLHRVYTGCTQGVQRDTKPTQGAQRVHRVHKICTYGVHRDTGHTQDAHKVHTGSIQGVPEDTGLYTGCMQDTHGAQRVHTGCINGHRVHTRSTHRAHRVYTGCTQGAYGVQTGCTQGVLQSIVIPMQGDLN